MEREEEFTFSECVDLEIRLTNQARLRSLLHYLCNDSLSGNTWIPPANPESVKLNGKEWRGALRQEATFLVTVLFCEINTYQYKGAGWHSTLHSQIVAVEHMRLNLHTWIFNISHQLISLVLATGRRVQGKQFVINIAGLKQNQGLKNLNI